MNIAFIGTGIMRQRMAANLIRAGHALTVCSRTRQKAEGLLAQGAKWADGAGAALGAAPIGDAPRVFQKMIGDDYYNWG